MRWKGFWTVAVSAALLLVGEQVLQACGPSPDPYDYYPSFFDNRLPERPAFGPFRYSAFTGLLYEDWYSGPPDSVGDTSDANREEWMRYTGGLPAADVDSFVYAYPRPVLAALYGAIEKNTPASLPGPVATNRMTAWFRQSADLEALGYLMYAKQCQPLVGGQEDPWTLPQRDTVRMGKLLKNGLQLHAVAQKDFIKTRYAYQVLRLALYSGDAVRALRLYDSLHATGATGEMGNRLLGLQAGALFKLKRYDEAAYRYSLLFDRADAWKRTAFISYDWSKGFEQPDAVLKRCATAHERAVVHLLQGLHDYEEALPHLERAYAEDPAVTGLDAVFTRELNKVEERYLQDVLLAQRQVATPYSWSGTYWQVPYDGTDKERAEADRQYQAYIGKLTAFAHRVTTENNGQRLTYWHLAQAYLAFLDANTATATAQLDAASKTGLTPLERDQAELLRLLVITRSAPRITPEVEAKMLPGLQWLDGRRKTSPRLDKSYRDLTGALLAGAYLAQKDTVKGIFALARAQRHWNETGQQDYSVDPDFGDEPGSLLEIASDAQLQAAKAYAAGTGATAYDRWLTGGEPYPLATLYELEGTKLLRQHRFAEAAVAFRKSTPPVLRRVLLPNPFVAHLRDQLELEAADTTRWYTKLDFAERMAALDGKTDAQSLFERGTGLYAMTYYGKAHHAFDYYRSSVDDAGYYEDSTRQGLPEFKRDYYDARNAEAAFVQCASQATDPELKAKALFMAAKCWQKRCPAPPVKYSFERNETKDYYRYSLKNPYFSRLKGEGGKTKLYQRAVTTCDYLADYAARR